MKNQVLVVAFVQNSMKYSVAESTLHFKSQDEKLIKTNILYNYLLLVKDSICKIYKGEYQLLDVSNY